MPFSSIWELQEAVRVMNNAICKWNRPLKKILDDNNVPYEELDSMRGVYVYQPSDVTPEVREKIEKVCAENGKRVLMLYELFGVIEDTRNDTTTNQ